MTTTPLAAIFENGPVLVSPESKGWFINCLAAAAKHDRIDELMADQGDGFWFQQDDWRASYRPYIVKDGILQIPIKGVLLNNFPWQLGSWATGYEYIWRAYERGMDDTSVRAIALITHSPGGLVAGNQVLVDKMYARRDEKPVRAFAQEQACSAAYNIASMAAHLAISPTGVVGSIGVYTVHLDWSKWNEQAGLKHTFIFAGEGKVDGNPEEPLSESAKERMQDRVDELYDVFVASVSRNRGLDEKAIRKDLKAYTYSASQAVSNGLADSIGSLDDALSAFAGSLDDPSDNEEGDEEMSTTDTSAVDQAAHESAVAAARNEGAQAAAAAMQERIGAILSSDEAKGRDNLAKHFAFKTDMSVEAALAALSEAPKATETEAAPVNHLENAMDNSTQPNAGAGAGSGEGQSDANSAAADLALAKSFGLKGFTS